MLVLLRRLVRFLESVRDRVGLGVVGLLAGCASPAESLTDDELLTLVQRRTFAYFWDGAEPVSGLARERIHLDDARPRNDRSIVTVGGTGFGVMAILVGIHRGFVTRPDGVSRLARIVGFLERADRFHGVWPHWLDGTTGRAEPFSPKDDGGDLVETALLMQGLLCVRQYLDGSVPAEAELARRIDELWRSVEWDRFRRDDVLYWHWSPNHGWAMNRPVRGYDECLIVYVLAAASPSHRVRPVVYHAGWARGGEIRGRAAAYGYELELRHNGAEQLGGPLFWAHYSYLGLDPRQLADRYASYFRHNRHHALINRAYCIENPRGYRGYGEDCWGLTASYSIDGYRAHRPGLDHGVIAPTAALASMPYTPEPSLRAMRFFYEQLGDRLWGPYGFYDAFSLSADWFPRRYLAIDQGPIVVMLENYRSGLLWELFMSCPEVRAGLDRLGFTY